MQFKFDDNLKYDVCVVGAGAAGLCAALFNAMNGKRVLVLESTKYIGGTSALSAATHWIPQTHHKQAVAGVDSLENAALFLRNAVGNRSSEALRMAFLENGGKAVAEIEKSDVKFRPRPYHPDYLSDLEGATPRGRAIEPLPFDGRKLGKHLNLIRPPIQEFTVLGGMMVDRDDIGHLLKLKTNLKSFLYSTKIILRHALDKLIYKRGTRLVMGNAYIAQLLYSLLKHDVTLLTNATLTALVSESVTITHNGETHHIAAPNVILASGGFNRNDEKRKTMLGDAHQDWCPGSDGHKGEAQDLALSIGAKYGEGALSHAFWAPVSKRVRKDGTLGVFPHFIMDRAKPNMLVVNGAGERFLNESTSYHLFGLAMLEAGVDECYLITDAHGLYKYGLGMVRPNGTNFDEFLQDGYLIKGETLEELAMVLKLPAGKLGETVTRFNSYATKGIDPEFARGTTEYQRQLGDLTLPIANPSLGTLTKAPFYAVKLYRGDIGAATGLLTNEKAQVLGADNLPIKGLYACGNDMHSIMGGTYPGPGITLGPALVFAYIASCDIDSKLLSKI